jgi:hypothetical protein
MSRLNHNSRGPKRTTKAEIKKALQDHNYKSAILFMIKFVLAWLVCVLIIASFVRCSPQQKANLCNDWAADHPAYFKSDIDTFFQEVITPADSIYFYIDLDSAKVQPITRTYKGLKLNFQQFGQKLKIDLLEPARIDTITVFRETITPAAKRPKAWRNKYFYQGLASGAGFFFFFLFLLLGLKIILK